MRESYSRRPTMLELERLGKAFVVREVSVRSLSESGGTTALAMSAFRPGFLGAGGLVSKSRFSVKRRQAMVAMRRAVATIAVLGFFPRARLAL